MYISAFLTRMTDEKNSNKNAWQVSDLPRRKRPSRLLQTVV